MCRSVESVPICVCLCVFCVHASRRKLPFCAHGLRAAGASFAPNRLSPRQPPFGALKHFPPLREGKSFNSNLLNILPFNCTRGAPKRRPESPSAAPTRRVSWTLMLAANESVVIGRLELIERGAT